MASGPTISLDHAVGGALVNTWSIGIQAEHFTGQRLLQSRTTSMSRLYPPSDQRCLVCGNMYRRGRMCVHYSPLGTFLSDLIVMTDMVQETPPEGLLPYLPVDCQQRWVVVFSITIIGQYPKGLPPQNNFVREFSPRSGACFEAT